MSTDLKNTVAKNLGVPVATLEDRIQTVLAENREAWVASGKDGDACEVLAVRVAGRQLKAESAKLQRSGAEVVEGMFVSVPRYKDWAQNAYKKMKQQLISMDEDQRVMLVEQGLVTIIQDNLDGSYTHTINPSFKTGSLESESAELTIQELPKFCEVLDDTTWFCLIENNNRPTWPSGDANPTFGRARRTSEPERTCTFLGRRNGGDVEVLTIKFEGDMAKEFQQTFVPGRIAVRMGKNGVGYAKPGVSNFHADESLATIFSGPPFQVTANGPTGSVIDLVGGVWPEGEFLPSFDLLPEHISKWADSKERWDKLTAVHGEVVHIDPREKGGYIVTVGDLDITSTAPAVDVYVPSEHEHLVDFGVGSEIVLVGRAWASRDGEARLDTTGWWVCDAIGASAAEAVEDSEEGGDGWDA